MRLKLFWGINNGSFHFTKINARKAYEQYKSATDGGIPGAQTTYDKLKVRFEKAGEGATVQVGP